MPERPPLLDDGVLTQMVGEIAAVLCKHVPGAGKLALRLETTHFKSRTCAQAFAFSPGQGGVFSVNAELRHPPPGHGHLGLKCTASKPAQ